MGKKWNPGISVGSSSILVIFVVLCLTTFATLSMISANSDYRLTARTAEAAKRYYEVDAQAVDLMGQLDDALTRLPLPTDAASLREIARDQGWSVSADGLVFSRSLPLEDTRTLEIAVDAGSYLTGSQTLRPVRWQVANGASWEDVPLEIYQGGQIQGLPQGFAN